MLSCNKTGPPVSGECHASTHGKMISNTTENYPWELLSHGIEKRLVRPPQKKGYEANVQYCCVLLKECKASCFTPKDSGVPTSEGDVETSIERSLCQSLQFSHVDYLPHSDLNICFRPVLPTVSNPWHYFLPHYLSSNSP